MKTTTNPSTPQLLTLTNPRASNFHGDCDEHASSGPQFLLRMPKRAGWCYYQSGPDWWKSRSITGRRGHWPPKGCHWHRGKCPRFPL